jgi:catechol 2,3-dioxygenase-like lactoylglutathione lyase family enzyme
VAKPDGKVSLITGATRGQAVHQPRPGGGVTGILNADDLYHTGIVVSDLDAAMAKLTRISGHQWTTPLSLTLPVETEAGQQDVDFRATYSLQAPHVELVQEIPGTIWTSVPGNAAHHLGFFVDDLAKKSSELAEAGFAREACACAEGQSPAFFAYHNDPLGIRIEIVDRSIFGDFNQFLQDNRQ